MARHVRTHTRARPFVCPSPGCSYSAMQKDHLKTHMLTHSTVKAFACPHCSFKTKRKEHLTRHTRRRHRASAVLPASAVPAAANSSAHKAVPKAVPKERITVKTSRFRGVSWAKGIGVWRSQIMSDRKTKHLGTYHSEVEAARAYDRAARQQAYRSPKGELLGGNYGVQTMPTAKPLCGSLLNVGPRRTLREAV